MKVQEISEMVNLALEGVEKSKLGPIKFTKDGKEEFNGVAYQAFIIVLSAILPKSFDSKVTCEEKPESWKIGGQEA